MAKRRMPRSVAESVQSRADDVCEYVIPGAGCGWVPTQIHHRRLRSQGGKHDAVTCVFICEPCHRYSHMNVEESYENGWLVHGWDDPADEPVLRRGRWVLLHEDGTITEETERS